MNERDVKRRAQGYRQAHRYGNCPCGEWHTLGRGLPTLTLLPAPAPAQSIFRPILAKAQYTAASLRALAAKLEGQHGQA